MISLNLSDDDDYGLLKSRLKKSTKSRRGFEKIRSLQFIAHALKSQL